MDRNNNRKEEGELVRSSYSNLEGTSDSWEDRISEIYEEGILDSLYDG